MAVAVLTTAPHITESNVPCSGVSSDNTPRINIKEVQGHFSSTFIHVLNTTLLVLSFTCPQPRSDRVESDVRKLNFSR